MKKQAKSKKWLLPVMVVVWAAVFYQIYAFAKPEKSAAIPTEVEWKLDTTQQVVEEEYTLLGGYKDPFGKGSFAIRSTSNRRAARPKTTNVLQSPTMLKADETQKPKKVKLPEIEFRGFASNKNSGTKGVLLSVNNQVSTYPVGTKKDDIHVSQANRDSVIIYVNTQRTIVHRKK